MCSTCQSVIRQHQLPFPLTHIVSSSYVPRFHARFGLRSRAPRSAARCGAASRLAVAATLLGALACNDSASAPPDPRGIRKVLVGVQADPTTLHASGEFVLRLVPLDGKGDPVLSDGLEIAPKVTAPTTQSLPPIATAVQRPDSRPLAAAVSIDDSKSMQRNDPTNQRAQAAQRFWTEVLSARSDNQVALVAFGGEQPTAPFTRTVLLQSWTSDQSALASAVTQLTASGQTYLYQSTAEVAPWVTATRPDASYRHALLLVTDGLPTDSLQADAAIQAAVGAEIPVFTVGLGPASDESGSIDTRAVERLRTLANATGGVYAGVENNAVLSTTFQSVGKLTTEGALLVTVRMTPAPAAGTAIKGAVRVGNQYGSASADWSFTAP